MYEHKSLESIAHQIHKSNPHIKSTHQIHTSNPHIKSTHQNYTSELHIRTTHEPTHHNNATHFFAMHTLPQTTLFTPYPTRPHQNATVQAKRRTLIRTTSLELNETHTQRKPSDSERGNIYTEKTSRYTKREDTSTPRNAMPCDATQCRIQNKHKHKETFHPQLPTRQTRRVLATPTQ
jgi:hypothetical protein